MAGFSQHLDKRFSKKTTEPLAVKGDGCGKIKKKRHPTIVLNKSSLKLKKS